jgi:hypothetical protein
MAISIDYTTRIISIPKADMTLVQSTPTEIRELDINNFRLALKDIEDSTVGVPFVDTHTHNTVVTVGGLTLARVVEIINGYTVTFEDGQYSVNLVGANSNIGDRVNANQVSVRSYNSAGLTSAPLIEYSSFGGEVHIDVVNGSPGTVFPIGTPLRPVNNLSDAILIANYRGFDTIHVLSNLTITTGNNLDNYNIRSVSWPVVTVESGVSLENTVFEKVSLYGVMGGVWNTLIDCWVYDITNFSGWVRSGSIGSVALSVGTPGAEFGGQSFFDDLVPLYPGVTSTVIMNTDTFVSFTDSSDITTIESMTTGSQIECGLHGGELIIDSSCTGGTIAVLGVGIVTNNSALVVDDIGLVNQDTVTEAVWDDLTAHHTTAGTMGKALSDAGAAGNPWGSPVEGNTAAGTFGELVGKKLLTVAKFLGLK